MRLEDVSGRDLVVEDLKAELRTECLRELMDLVARRRGLSLLQKESYLAQVLQRHERLPSGLCRGLAFPNARIADLRSPILAIGISRKGLDFQAWDGRPTHVVLLYLGNADPSEQERAMLRRLSRALADPEIAEALAAARSVDEVWETLLAIDSDRRVGAR